MALPRLYPILDTTVLTLSRSDPVTVSEAILEGGARILQFRHKGSYTREVFHLAERIAGLCRSCGAVFVVDDRADIALMTGGGLHVGQQDLAANDARKLLGEGAFIGLSTHDAAQLKEAAREPVDYVAMGPIFATRSKENPDPVVGLDGLRAAAAGLTLPLVAIGGITRANAREVLEAGADSVAVIRDILPDNCSFPAVRQRMEEWQQLVKR